MSHTPTFEQQKALDLFATGRSFAIEAGAGTGKTSTLVMLAETTGRTGRYIAFNKAIVADAAEKMPRNVACQPDGTMVRIPSLSRPGREGNAVEWVEVPIESIEVGDKVVSWNQTHGPVVRKRGRTVTAVSRRPYDGQLVVVEADGYQSRYTVEHPCIIDVGDAFDGKWLVYMQRRGDHFRIGIAAWVLYDGRNGLVRRLDQQGADAAWILSVHDDRDEALIAEALTQYEYGIPGWQFADIDGTPLPRLWEKIPSNIDAARSCLAAFGRDIDEPILTASESRKWRQQVHVTAACNLMTGMRVLVADHAKTKGEFGRASTPRSVWTRATVTREHHVGQVTSLTVADDHTYFADGILTHNCSTAHSLAFRAVGRQFAHRLNSGRIRSDQIARHLGIRGLDIVVGGMGRRTLAGGFLAGHVMRAVTRFCQTADETPTARHIAYLDGIDLPDADGRRTFENNRVVAEYLAPFVARAWADVSDPNGTLPYRHDHYLKLWQLSNPVVDADFILFDEVQDADPVMADIVLRQQARGVQVVLVGDSQQAIYEWRGAVNAFDLFGLDDTTFLTQSWRFGDAIAEQANLVLGMIPDAALRLIGTPGAPSFVQPVAAPRAVLTRTNATAMREVFGFLAEGVKPHLVGGGGEIVSFARGAQRLMAGQRCDHPELACFESWDEVVTYVANDAQGDELRLMVKLMEEFTPERIISTLGDRMPSEAQADVIVSTAHKAKGREWDTVRLTGDFGLDSAGTGPATPELRLLYVAVTRARVTLDVTMVPLLAEPQEAEVEVEVEQLPAFEIVSDAVLDGTIQPEPQAPRACPQCGRTDVYRERTGLIGVHRCG